ncbi:osmotically inducible protein C, partial [Pseudomonas sp. SIMBA_067]
KIYAAAKHPKSFISLDNADHLLSNKEDANYAADVIATWANRYVEYDKTPYSAKLTNGSVLVEEKDHKFTQHVSTK